MNINKSDYIYFNMHIMWYESEMLNETLDSIYSALQYSTIPVKFKFCLNYQTYVESPIDSDLDAMFNKFKEHPLMKNVDITIKDNTVSFFNIGDWRREEYDINAKYTVWGESDCLLPIDFFYILSNLDIKETHVLSFASRKMWDHTWDCVEHLELEYISREGYLNEDYVLHAKRYISQTELDEFNDRFNIEIIKNNGVKIDGSLLCISKNIQYQLIPNNLHFVSEDYCAQLALEFYRVPQYVVKTKIKGHNYVHPLKRTNTNNTRNDSFFLIKKEESLKAFHTFINSLYNNK